MNNHLIEGFHGIAGEWGHNYLSEAEGCPCFCGKKGCNESILAGPALERYYAEQRGQPLGLKEIADRAADGSDAVAAQTMRRLTNFFGLALSKLINVLDPAVLIIGGGVGNIDCLYQEGVANVSKYVFDHQLEAPVVKPLLGDSAGGGGAAYLVA